MPLEAITLQKHSEDLTHIYSNVYKARREAASRFEKEHKATIKNYNFKHSDLVLLCNSQIEMALNTKMQPHYTGPLIVLSRNTRGAYIICELDGSVFHHPIAAFRVVPYFACKQIDLPDDLPDIDKNHLRHLENTTAIDK